MSTSNAHRPDDQRLAMICVDRNENGMDAVVGRNLVTRSFAAMAAAVTLGGCSLALFAGVDATDLSTVQTGSTRADVETVLGQPISRGAGSDEEVLVYAYSMGAEIDGYGFLYDIPAVLVLDIAWYGIPEKYFAQCIEESKRAVRITYDDSGVVRGVDYGTRSRQPPGQPLNCVKPRTPPGYAARDYGYRSH